MKTNYTIFFFVLFLNIQAQTIIPVNSSVSGNWTKTNSPYLIKGNISVPKDSTLTIEPGVEVRFDGKYQLSVYGKIKALGKEGDTIRFYPQDTLNRWRGIRFYGNNQTGDSAVFEYCKFENSGPKLTNSESCLRLTRGHFRINNCVFTKNQGVFSSNSISADSILSLEINACYFYKNRNVNTNPSLTLNGVTGVVFLSKGKINNCIFSENVSRNSFYSQDQYAVNGDGSKGIIEIIDFNSPNTLVEISNCKFNSNYCGLGGAGVNFRLTGASKLLIKNCEFENNRTGRYGCITSIGDINNPKGNVKVVIETCSFKNNIAANPTVLDGVSCIIIESFKTYDSLIIRNNLFESNSARTTVSIGTPNESRQYVIGNVFRGNAIWCLADESSGEVFSINNLYYNNLATTIFGSSNQNYQLTSINDAFLYNGPNLDTIALNSRLLNTYVGQYYKFDGSAYMGFGGGGVFRNSIFWGNRNYNGKITNITLASGRVKEITHCIFEGNSDSSIIWDNSSSRPSPIVLSYNSNLNINPLFEKPPLTFGPNGMDTASDFHLKNTCNQLSPAYNAGIKSAFPSLSSLTDFDGKPRIFCDTVDIGPYEMGRQFARVKIYTEPKDSSYCDNAFSVALQTTCNPNSSFSWQIKQGNTWSNLPNASSSVYQPGNPQAGTYRAIYKQNDCNLSDTSPAFNVSLVPSPKPFIGNDTTIEQKASLTLDAGSYSSYRWQDGATTRIYAVNGNTQGISEKTYWVQVTAANGCSGSDSIKVNVTWNSSLESLLDKGWKLYPNPSNGIIHLESPDGKLFNINVTDQSGRNLLNRMGISGNLELDLSVYPAGVYFLKIEGEGFTEILKLIRSQ